MIARAALCAFSRAADSASTAKPLGLCASPCRRPQNCWPIRLMTAPRSGIGLRGAAPPRSFPTRSIAASPFPITSAPIVTATRSSVLPPQGRAPRRYPLRQMRPELPQRSPLDRRHLLLVKLSLDPRTFPATTETENTASYQGGAWPSKRDSNQSMRFICIAFSRRKRGRNCVALETVSSRPEIQCRGKARRLLFRPGLPSTCERISGRETDWTSAA